MATTFDDLLKKYCDTSLSEAEKGTKFEELMRAYLMSLPKFPGMFADVWLWRDFPDRKDSGIVNDPNKWLKECGNERYIVDLILKVVTVSMETQKRL